MPPRHDPTRRRFLQAAGLSAGAVLVLGGSRRAARAADADDPAPAAPTPADPGPLRFVFATDVHLMAGDRLRSDLGLVRCLQAIEALRPRPEFILCGGDLTHESPFLDPEPAARLLDRFRQLWADHTALPTRYTFGNHDLVATRLPGIGRGDDPRAGKGLFRQRLGLEKTYYSFDAGSWHFVVLDDVTSLPDGTYQGEYAQEQLAFLGDDLSRHAAASTILCGHIPGVSLLPALAGLARLAGGLRPTAGRNLVARNTPALLRRIAESRANVKLVLAGHLHRFEQTDVDGIRFVNSGAVCGNYWKGAQAGCPEGFLVVDLAPGGRFAYRYQSYGWRG